MAPLNGDQQLNDIDAQPRSRKTKQTHNLNSIMHYDKALKETHENDADHTDTRHLSAPAQSREHPADHLVSSSESEIFSGQSIHAIGTSCIKTNVSSAMLHRR